MSAAFSLLTQSSKGSASLLRQVGLGDDTLSPYILFVACAGLFLAAAFVLATRVLKKDKSVGVGSLPPPGSRVAIIFGSQTGTAERFSRDLAMELNQVLDLPAVPMGAGQYDYENDLGKEKLVIFCVATYGDGEPTDDAHDVYEWLEQKAKENDSEEFSCLKYAVFGLGSRQYEHFNAVGRGLERFMKKLGVEAVCTRGEGDDDDDIQRDFDAWKENVLLPSLPKAGFTFHQRELGSIATAGRFLVSHLPKGTKPSPLKVHKTGHYDAQHPYVARVVAQRELHTSKSERSCVHVEVDLGDSGMSYVTGDHVWVLPRNAPHLVTRAAQLLGVEPDLDHLMVIHGVENTDVTPPFMGTDTVHTLRDALSMYFDLTGPPTRTALMVLASAAGDEAEKRALTELATSTSAGRAAYKATVTDHWLSVVGVMERFPSARPDLGVFLASVASRIQPRAYSISSSSLLHPKHVHITCAVVSEDVAKSKKFGGLCSTYLASLQPGDEIRVYTRTSHFRLPSQRETDIVMVGPGTGLAPFRGFCQERQALVAQGVKLGRGTLYFGCRQKEKDYIYREELEQWQKQAQVLTDLHVAFSRATNQKVYVQHLLARDAELVWNVVSQGGYVYVCGDAKTMARDVHLELVNLFVTRKEVSVEEAERELTRLADTGHILKDVW
jgi:NADPH-ferrihemoprotein reductase